ncbi:hypothetical protein BD626DRAFT_473164 [Schizophyllum amplum]|uniref:Uncharacterized protein n=1 Tax=Schizophyllum amplum TaxID=97359 RepID=A0A550CWM3_9AGAR|nr:hypothetical protein BD626DRAFT_473164 [Auriculariopsis ampla]
MHCERWWRGRRTALPQARTPGVRSWPRPGMRRGRASDSRCCLQVSPPPTTATRYLC